MTTVRALILDLGEVLVHGQPPDTMAAMARCARAPAGAFASAYWRTFSSLREDGGGHRIVTMKTAGWRSGAWAA
jgi:hypothetical protein